jgi:hypothetical protein
MRGIIRAAMPADGLSLSNLVGQNIAIKIPAFKEGKLITVKLCGVEAGGVWIESHDFMESIPEGTPTKMTPRSFVIFVPYTQILAIYYPGGGPWISEKVVQ